MNRSFLFALGLALIAPATFAQTAGKLDPGSEEQVVQREAMLDRQVRDAAHTQEQAERQAWLRSTKNLAKLRIKLAEAWQNMGVPAPDAKLIADAYDPHLATSTHRASLRGKSDEEIAQMLESAIKQKRYLSANQLLIDYERTRLGMGTNSTSGVNW